MAAIMNYYKLNGFKQCHFIILLLSGSGVQPGCHWAEHKVLAGLRSLLEALGKNLFS